MRAYHAALGVLVLLAFLSGDWGAVHAWFGYGVAALIGVRLIMALTGIPQLGLMRFYPHFEGLKLGTALTHPAISRTLLLAIALVTIATVGTGIAMDRGRTLGFGRPEVAAAASDAARPSYVSSDREGHGKRDGDHDRRGQEGPWEDIHEFLGNLLIVLVAAHVTYLLLFKRALARYMLFLPGRRG